MAGLVGKMLDRYRLVEQIGQGGMATVYRAVDTKSMNEYAIKVLSPTIAADRRFVLRFRREASLVKRHLDHPYIVPVVDYGEAEGYIYLVMPFLKGETLHDCLVRGSLTQNEKAQWVGQVSEALDFAHSKGVIHRDIKPSNVMITEDGDALLMDFGLAREIEGSNTLTGSMLMGTPAYVSPEQGRGEKLDSRSDQYSFGVILYQIATGRLPFEAEAPMAIVMQHLQDQVPRPGRFNRDLSEGEEKVIVKSLAKRPEDRFENMGELNEAYQAAIAGRRMPEFELPPAAATMSMPRREAVSPLDTQIVAPELERRRFPWWIVPVLLVGAIALGALALPSVFGASGESTPTGNSAATLQPTETKILVIGGTPVKTPTISQVTDTPFSPITSDDCPGITLHPPTIDGNYIKWLLDNRMGETVEIMDLQLLAWPAGNGRLTEVRFNDVLIWQGEFEEGELLELVEGVAFIVEPQSPVILAFKFAWAPGPAGYEMNIEFDQGCRIEGMW
jgi:serine/threonine-protein kinase